MLRSLFIGAGWALLAAAPALAACASISSTTLPLTGCVDSEWVKQDGSGAQEFTFMTADQKFGLQLITEQGAIPVAKFREAIIGNAIAGVGGNKDDVKIVREDIINVDGKPFNVIEYSIPNAGSPILFQNFYYSAPGFGLLQVLLFSREADATAASYKAGVFASALKIGD